MLTDCGGVVCDTPRQDVLPRLEAGLLAQDDRSGRGTLYPQPRLADGRLMDQRHGCGWRLVIDAALVAPAHAAGLTVVAPGDAAKPDATSRDGDADLQPLRETERDAVVATWMQRHACHAAVLRPDRCVYGTAATATGLDALLVERRVALVD